MQWNSANERPGEAWRGNRLMKSLSTSASCTDNSLISLYDVDESMIAGDAHDKRLKLYTIYTSHSLYMNYNLFYLTALILLASLISQCEKYDFFIRKFYLGVNAYNLVSIHPGHVYSILFRPLKTVEKKIIEKMKIFHLYIAQLMVNLYISSKINK